MSTIFTAIILEPGATHTRPVGPTSESSHILGNRSVRDAYPSAEVVLVVPWHRRRMTRRAALAMAKKRAEEARWHEEASERRRREEEADMLAGCRGVS